MDAFRMKVLRVTVELYMGLTNRNMDQWHTEETIRNLEDKLAELTQLLTELLAPFVGTTDEVDMNMPKFHDLQHIIFMIRIRGCAQFHSCEG